MELGLRNKVAVVTASTANIGKAIALDLATEGARLLVTGRDREAGRRIVDEAQARGAADAFFVPADLLEPGAAVALAAAAKARYGEVDILVNNLGGNVAAGLFKDTDPASWQKDIEITFGTMLAVTHAMLPLMIGRGWGRIINMGSTAGAVGDYLLSVYSAAKGAVDAFTRVLAKEVGEHGITVNCVAPYGTQSDDPADFSSGSRFHPDHGFFPREFFGLPPEMLGKLMRNGPLGRTVAKPDEVAAAVLYLASTRAGFTTGQTLYVDGGTRL